MHHGDVIFVHIHAVWPDVPEYTEPVQSDDSCSQSGQENWGSDYEESQDEEALEAQEEDQADPSMDPPSLSPGSQLGIEFYVWYINHHTFPVCDWQT